MTLPVHKQQWIDWTPVEGSYGEWALESVEWKNKQFDEDYESYLVVQLINNLVSKRLVLEFFTLHYRFVEEHFVADEPGYISYQRHSLYTVQNSLFIDSYYDNPYWLYPRKYHENGPKPISKSDYIHYRIITYPNVVDVIGVLFDAKIHSI